MQNAIEDIWIKTKKKTVESFIVNTSFHLVLYCWVTFELFFFFFILQ